MADHPDWNFDNSGNPVETAPTSHQELVTQIANADAPPGVP